ncbi:MAG: rod shape-determining protein MreD [Eubacteriales bacterium]|nr:rod shape-determining protein MreD [Eubacteriales bacterium]
MKTKLILAGTMLACLLLQCSLMPAISIASITPNLMIVFTVSFGLMRGKRSGMILGFICGLLTDLMIPGLFVGLRAFVYMYIGYFCGYCYRIFYDDDIKMPVILTAAGDLVYGIAFYATQFMLRGRIQFFFYLRRVILPEMVYTILMTFVFYRLFLLLNRQLEKMDKRSVGSFV